MSVTHQRWLVQLLTLSWVTTDRQIRLSRSSGCSGLGCSPGAGRALAPAMGSTVSEQVGHGLSVLWRVPRPVHLLLCGSGKFAGRGLGPACSGTFRLVRGAGAVGRSCLCHAAARAAAGTRHGAGG